MTVIRMPEVATGSGSASIQNWTVAVGDAVGVGQVIVEIETEKAVVEYEAEVVGVFAGTLLEEGESADVGAPIAVVAVGGQSIDEAMREVGHAAGDAQTPPDGESMTQEGSTPGATAQGSSTSGSAQPAETAEPAPSGPTSTSRANGTQAASRRQFMSPLVRRLAREQGIDLTGIVGSGPHGRIVRRDLAAIAAGQETAALGTEQSTAVPPPTQSADAPKAEVSAHPAHGSSFVEIPLTGMRRAIARRLAESKATVPHFYLAGECRVDDLLELRAQLNDGGTAKISVNDLVVKAAAWALKDVPEANASWTDEAIRRYDHVDMSVAVALPDGLITPVLRGVDQMSVSEVSSSVRDLVERARNGRLKQHQIEGGSFSVSNLGMYGVGEFSAIINPPQSGILAIGAARRQPVVFDDDLVRVGTVMTATLSADHRVIDGAIAAQWLAAFVKRIENPLSILL